jgi:hypothetical protein
MFDRDPCFVESAHRLSLAKLRAELSRKQVPIVEESGLVSAAPEMLGGDLKEHFNSIVQSQNGEA